MPTPGIEPESYPYQGYVLPLYYAGQKDLPAHNGVSGVNYAHSQSSLSEPILRIELRDSRYKGDALPLSDTGGAGYENRTHAS